MSVASQDPAVRAGLDTPLCNIGELPCDVFLECLALVPAHSRDRIVKRWSERLAGVAGVYCGSLKA